MHSELDKLHSALKGEADHILYELGFLHRLNRFGSTVVSGSYFLEVMTWRDLDLYLAVDADEMDEAAFFDLGKEIVTCIHPSKMNYRHTYGGQSRHLPQGYYWGCYAQIQSYDWKVDVWAISPEETARKQQKLHDIKTNMNDMQRLAIMQIKHSLHHHPLYRKHFFSLDIYNAVLEDRVDSVDGFRKWLQQHRDIRL